jgi:hypothetical protein
MDIKLVVVRAFGTHARGDVINDAGEIARVLAGEHAACVVRVLASGKGG